MAVSALTRASCRVEPSAAHPESSGLRRYKPDRLHSSTGSFRRWSWVLFGQKLTARCLVLITEYGHSVRNHRNDARSAVGARHIFTPVSKLSQLRLELNSNSRRPTPPNPHVKRRWGFERQWKRMANLSEFEKLLPSLSPGEKAQILKWVVQDLADAFPGIDSRPDVCGGEPCVVRTRIPIWLLDQARPAWFERTGTTGRLPFAARRGSG